MQKELDLSFQAGKASQIIDKCNLVCSKTNTIADKFVLLKQQYSAQQQLPRGIAVTWNDEQRSELIAAANQRQKSHVAVETLAEKTVGRQFWRGGEPCRSGRVTTGISG
ncbi:hypothetical protein O5552_10610 [Escherichia coli]|nr:hypothetical protein [Escherichia coli]